MTTKEDVQQSINSRLKTEPTLIEGGTVQDIVGSVTFELANIISTDIEILEPAFKNLKIGNETFQVTPTL